jgi:uncharacterized protein
MNEEANTQTVRELYRHFASGNVHDLLKLCSPDVNLTVPEVENSPFTASWQGRDSLKTFLGLVSETEDFNDFEPLDFIAQGDRVVVLGRMTATVRATGRHYSTDWVHVFTIKGGKMTAFHEYYDTAAALRAFQKATFA